MAKIKWKIMEDVGRWVSSEICEIYVEFLKYLLPKYKSQLV